MNPDPIVIVSAARTPMGAFQGELKGLSAPELGAAAIRAAVERAKLTPEDIEEVLMGCVLPAGQGQAPARQASLGAGAAFRGMHHGQQDVRLRHEDRDAGARCAAGGLSRHHGCRRHGVDEQRTLPAAPGARRLSHGPPGRAGPHVPRRAGGRLRQGPAEPADGHTLGIIYTPHTVLPHLQKTLPYDALRDFSAVTQLTEAPLVLVVHPALPVQKVPDLIALAKTRPLVYGSASNGSGGHLSGELLKQMAKIDATHVPYKGAGPAAIDLMAGQLQFQFGSHITTRGFVAAGRLRAIAVTSAKRSPELPNLPTVAEQGLPGFEFVNWFGMVAPARTPAAIVSGLQQKIAQGLQQPATHSKLVALDSTVLASTPVAFGAFLAADLEKWGTLLRNSGVKVD